MCLWLFASNPSLLQPPWNEPTALFRNEPTALFLVPALSPQLYDQRRRRKGREGSRLQNSILPLSGIKPVPVWCMNPSFPTALPTELRGMALWRGSSLSEYKLAFYFSLASQIHYGVRSTTVCQPVFFSLTLAILVLFGVGSNTFFSQ